jgi:hypothetical protein
MSLHFMRGDQVRTIRPMHLGPTTRMSYRWLRKYTVGEVLETYSDMIRVKFPGVKDMDRGMWFLTSKGINDPGPQNEYVYRAYPPTDLLELANQPSTLEGTEFTIEKDNGDGTFLVRKS